MIYFYRDNWNNPIMLQDISKECWKFMVDSKFLKQAIKFEELFEFSDYYKINIVVSEKLEYCGRVYIARLNLNDRYLGFVKSSFSKLSIDTLIDEIKENYKFFSRLLMIARNSKK